MIKVGIYGPATLEDPVRKQLLRLLLRHPDVDLRAVASPAGNTVPIAELHPVYAGETELTLERVLCLDNLDVLFVIDEENLTPEILEKFRNDSDFKLIVLGKAANLRKNLPSDIVYGLPEANRKALVRGARAAVSPTPESMIIELALFPLAKNALLNNAVTVDLASKTELGEAVAEAEIFLGAVQPSFGKKISFKNSPEAPYERLDAEIRMKTPIAIEEIERLYRDAYDDHNFVYVVPGFGGLNEDLRGSNKCLLQLNKEEDTLVIHATMDALTKGCTGNAVHIMDLLYGLHERTGLSI